MERGGCEPPLFGLVFRIGRVSGLLIFLILLLLFIRLTLFLFAALFAGKSHLRLKGGEIDQ
jgi:hypothetical protein